MHEKKYYSFSKKLLTPTPHYAIIYISVRQDRKKHYQKEITKNVKEKVLLGA